MNKFNEEIFIKALVSRTEDARRFQEMFKPEWITTSQYRPILAEIYSFTKEFGIPPTFQVLHSRLEELDGSNYTTRLKPALDKIERTSAETADYMYQLKKAKDAAICRSLEELVHSTGVTSSLEENRGGEILEDMTKWARQFDDTPDDYEMLNVKEAISSLMEERGWKNQREKVRCGIPILDEWTEGGLQPGQTAIILASTGAGKSVSLTVIAYKMAALEGKNVLFISNELSMHENTERYLSLMSGESISEVIADPLKAHKSEVKRHWASYMGLQNKLVLVDLMGKEVSTDFIEGELLSRLRNLKGWVPDTIVIDFMERMKPVTASGMKRDQTWTWYKAIAKDITRLAKRYKWIIWTAGQLNREAYAKNKELHMGMAQGSVQHLQEVNYVFLMQKMKADLGKDEGEILQFYAEKTRNTGHTGQSRFVEANLRKMQITDRYREINDWTSQDEDDASLNYKKKS